VLGALPDAAIVVVSGAFSSNPQEQLKVGTLASALDLLSHFSTPLLCSCAHISLLTSERAFCTGTGVGTLAGSTIMLLTIPWAVGLWLARYVHFRERR
jgi:hypothetical protein